MITTPNLTIKCSQCDRELNQDEVKKTEHYKEYYRVYLKPCRTCIENAVDEYVFNSDSKIAKKLREVEEVAKNAESIAKYRR